MIVQPDELLRTKSVSYVNFTGRFGRRNIHFSLLANKEQQTQAAIKLCVSAIISAVDWHQNYKSLNHYTTTWNVLGISKRVFKS